MITYHCNSNTILLAQFQTNNETNRIAAYSSVMKRLNDRVHSVDLQIFYNEASADYRRVLEEG